MYSNRLCYMLSFFLSFFLGGEFVGQEGRTEDIPGKGQDLFGELLHAVAVDDYVSLKKHFFWMTA